MANSTVCVCQRLLGAGVVSDQVSIAVHVMKRRTTAAAAPMEVHVDDTSSTSQRSGHTGGARSKRSKPLADLSQNDLILCSPVSLFSAATA